jgi:hypothetical protein
MAQKARRIQLLAQFSGGKPTAVKALFSILRSSVEVSDVVKTVNYVNYELSGRHWLAGSEVRVTLGDVGINTGVAPKQPGWGRGAGRRPSVPADWTDGGRTQGGRGAAPVRTVGNGRGCPEPAL